MAGWVQIKSTGIRGPGQGFSRFDVLGSLINSILVLVSVVTVGWLRDRGLGFIMMGSQAIQSMSLSPADRAILRRAASAWSGAALPASIGGRLRLAQQRFQILRDRSGNVAGFGRDGFVLTPAGSGLYCWGEDRQRQAHINGV